MLFKEAKTRSVQLINHIVRVDKALSGQAAGNCILILKCIESYLSSRHKQH